MSENKSEGFGVFGVVQIVFVVLKVLDLIDWSWIWVLSPLWIGWSLVLLFALARENEDT